MIFQELNENEFMEFVDNNKTKNFFQTLMMKEKFDNDKCETYLVGVKEDNKVIGAALIASKDTFLGYKTFEAYKGFIMDYSNIELLHFFTKEIIIFLKNKKCYRFLIDPYIPNVTRDCDANIIDGVDNRYVRKELEKLGYKYLENGQQVKWCYCLDINGKSSEELLNEMRPNTRNYINRTISKYKLEVKTLNYDELDQFKKITEDTCERREFGDKSLKYYQNMYNIFKDKVTFKICSLNCDTYIKTLEEENKILEEKINTLSDSSSNAKKKETMKKDLENNLKKINDTNELKNKSGNIIPLSAAMFILYGDEIVYLFSGSYANLMNFCGQYRLQWEIIKYAADNKYQRYNFYGIQDVFNKQGKDYGVYEFKKGFGGYVEELIGPFELSISPMNSIIKTLRKIKHIIKK